MTPEGQRVAVYDTTLRDGGQARSIAWALGDKLAIAERLDDFGVAFIEGGWPNPTNPKDLEFFQRARELTLKNARLVAFGSTMRLGLSAAEDHLLRALLEAETEVVAIFGKSWDLHVDKVLRVSLDDNLRMIEQSVRHLKSHGREVVFDAEHYFDGHRAKPQYALRTIQVAQEAGADWIVLCDTNGGTMTHQLQQTIADTLPHLRVPWGIHCHNDAGLGVANTLTAVLAGASQVQGTINGYGERTGNADLCQVIANLELHLGYHCVGPERLAKLTSLSRYVDELANIAHDERRPYVGPAAFSHKGGTHIDGIVKERRSFEHVDPAAVGNIRHLLLSDQAGTRAIVERLHDEFPELEKTDPRTRQILERVKELENQGYQFEAAEGSFRLLARKVLGAHTPLFELERFRIMVGKHGDAPPFAEALVRVRVNEESLLFAAEGNGPVNALDNALRKALVGFYPELNDIELTDYKVRVLEEEHGTSSKVRVLIETTDHEDTWGTVGASENIILASWEALVDSLEYGVALRREKAKQEPSSPG